MSINGNQKGKAGEREGAAYLRSLGFGDAFRSQQFCGDAGDSDVGGLGNVFIEVKRVETLDVHTDQMRKFCEKASEQAGPNPWAVLWRRNREPWRLTTDVLIHSNVSRPRLVVVTLTGDSDIRDMLVSKGALTCKASPDRFRSTKTSNEPISLLVPTRKRQGSPPKVSALGNGRPSTTSKSGSPTTGKAITRRTTAAVPRRTAAGR